MLWVIRVIFPSIVYIILAFNDSIHSIISLFVAVQGGWNSLMKASFEGHDKIVEILLEGGAKPDNGGMVSVCDC